MRYRLTLTESGDCETYLECWDGDWMFVNDPSGRQPEVVSITLADAKRLAIEHKKSDALHHFITMEEQSDTRQEGDEEENELVDGKALELAWRATTYLYEYEKKMLAVWLLLGMLTEDSADEAINAFNERRNEEV